MIPKARIEALRQRCHVASGADYFVIETTEPELLALLDAYEARELVCEWKFWGVEAMWSTGCSGELISDRGTFCPSCGNRIVFDSRGDLTRIDKSRFDAKGGGRVAVKEG